MKNIVRRGVVPLKLNNIISRFGVAAAIFLTVTALAMAGFFEMVGFDVQFESKGQPEEDQSFAQAIKKHGRAVLACSFNFGRDQQEGGALKAPGGGFSIPLDRQKPYHLINFWGPQGSFKTYSYADVLEGKYSPETFRDKIVLVGPTSPFFHDYFNIPYTRSNMILQNNLPTPGVEIHAAAINTFLNSAHFTRAG